MDGLSTKEVQAECLVGVGRDGPSGGFFIVLRNPGGRSVYLGPYANRDVAELEANRVRGFVAAVIREACGSGQDDPIVEDAAKPNDASTVIASYELRRQFRAIE
jgi:hypothetical protein